jgi:hypothetical protein
LQLALGTLRFKSIVSQRRTDCRGSPVVLAI